MRRAYQFLPVDTTMRWQDWTFVGMVVAGLLAFITLLQGNYVWAVVWSTIALFLFVVARISSKHHPGPMSYALRWFLFAPRPYLSYKHLKQILELKEGERLLEIGPGNGIHALPVASALTPKGRLDVLDIQQAMLLDLMDRAQAKKLANIFPTQGDATRLPYVDNTFDAVYLITVLGEIPAADQALREIRRVLKPKGRLVIG
ncbi:MAG: methyltransferase domain-containing protein, partial [Acidobacteriota bacterium]